MKKLMKTMIMMLLFSGLVAAFAGCESLQDSGISHKEKFIEQLKQDADVDSGTIEFTADLFAQHIALSWMYSIDVKIDNGNIYLNDDLYDNVEIISNPEITYNTELFGGTDTVDDEKISEVLEKSKNSESCYMLETQNSDGTSKEIAVYKIDGVYYFLSFLEDYEVLRIHYSNVDISLSHVHDFRQKWDETKHFKECSCGEITDRAEHTLEWVVDSEPTYTAPGYKHKECTTCTYKTDENTLIGILSGDPGIDPTPITHKNFVTHGDLINFFSENQEKIGKHFLSLKATSDSERGIYIVEEGRNLFKYTFKYDELEGVFINPYIKTYFSVYSVELGTDTDVMADVPYHSFTLEFVSKGCNQSVTNLQFEFSDCDLPDSRYKRVVRVYEENQLIGEGYLRFSIEISDEWFINYFGNYLFVL